MSAQQVVEAACALVDANIELAHSSSDTLPVAAVKELYKVRLQCLRTLAEAVAAYRAESAPVEWTCEAIMRREG